VRREAPAGSSCCWAAPPWRLFAPLFELFDLGFQRSYILETLPKIAEMPLTTPPLTSVAVTRERSNNLGIPHLFWALTPRPNRNARMKPEAALLPAQRVDLVDDDALETQLLKTRSRFETSVAYLPRPRTALEQSNQPHERLEFALPHGRRPIQHVPPGPRTSRSSLQATAPGVKGPPNVISLELRYPAA
jgi:hypothetical protein